MHQRTRSGEVKTAVFDLAKWRLPEFTKPVSVITKQAAEPTIIQLASLSETGRDVCAQRAICRLAAKLGCRFCIA